jgi:hypothetical protein
MARYRRSGLYMFDGESDRKVQRRAHHTVFYDEARERVLVAAGGAVDSRRNSTLFNDLWVLPRRTSVTQRSW